MKNLMMIFLTVFFSAEALFAQQELIGKDWSHYVAFGQDQGTFYSASASSVIFVNKGMTVTDGTYTPLFVPNWTEKISLQMVPRVFHVTLKVDSLKADSLEIYLAVGRGVNQWSLLGEKKVIIKNGEYSFGWNTSIVSFDSMDVVTFVFQFRTSQSSETYGVVKVEESTTGVVNQQVIPKNFTLSQNYPNPFNPTTKIQFSLTSRSNVKLVVLNLIGQEVKTLVNEEKGQGNYEVSFDASKFSSGVYFYRLTAGSFTETRKMILIK